MGKDVLLVAHFCNDFDGEGNGRFNYLADLLASNGYAVEFVTSDFSHTKKKKRDKQTAGLHFNVTYIPEPSYSRNVSIKRFYSHFMMGRNLKKYLKTRKKPDVIYCAVPSLDAAMAVSKYARKNKVKFIIDVQDLWPEAFRMVFNIPVVSDLIFYPMEKMADHIYQSADEIVAVSETYMNRALKVNKKLQSGHCIYLGTDLHQFDLFPVSSMKNSKLEGEIWIAYVGTLGSSYDLISVIDALRILCTQTHWSHYCSTYEDKEWDQIH